SRVPGSQAGSGPGIRINGVANFGGPVQANADSGFGFTEGIFQILDNLTYIRGNHAYKFGFNAQAVSDSRTQTLIQLYTFANVDAFLAARSGPIRSATPRSSNSSAIRPMSTTRACTGAS